MRVYRLTIFGTGSRGNSALVSDGETNILIDAGLWPKGTMISSLDAVLITHGHGDHAKYVPGLSARYNRQIYATKGTLAEMYDLRGNGHVIHCGICFDVGTLEITPFPLSHDAAEPCGFFIRNDLNESLVWCGDTGTMDGLEMSEPADCYVIEANYDKNDIDKKLENGELPYAGLHGRLTSDFGHLSIQQAAAWVEENAGPESHIIVLSSHPEVLGRGKELFDYSCRIHMPLLFPFTYKFGKECPF